MALTEQKAGKALRGMGPDGRLTHEQAAKVLGVSRVRVTQLVTMGELVDLREQAVREYKTAKQKKKAEAAAFKERMREKREAERQELLEAIRIVQRDVRLLAAALGAKGIVDTILR